MSQMTLTETRLIEGVWEAVLKAPRRDMPAPSLKVHHHDKPIEGLSLRAGDGPGVWFLRFPIPPEVISDGVQTFVISDAATNAVVATFSLLAGDVLDHDLRAEISLLRAELDMLKRAFRRHCAETA
jgi:hypothetical protein